MSEFHPYPLYHPLWQPEAAPPRASMADTRCSNLMHLALMGGLIGGAASAAANLRRVNAGEVEIAPAAAATARSAAIGAAATVAAAAVAGAVADQGLLRLGLMFAVGTAVVYGLDRIGGDSDGGFHD